MPDILSLSPHAKPGLCVLSFEDGAELVLFADVVVMFRLSAGPVSEGVLREAALENNRRAALSAALKKIGYKRLTEKELRQYLKGKKFDADAVTYAMAKVTAYGYLDDAGFAADYVSSRGGMKGNRALAFDLKNKGVPEEHITAALKDEAGERAACEAAARKFARSRDLTDIKERQRLMRHLAYRGFGYAVVSDVMKTLCLPGTVFGEEE